MSVVLRGVSGNLVDVTALGEVKIAGSFVATDPSVGTIAAPVPLSGAYVGMNVGGNLIGLTGTVNGLKVDGSAITQPVSIAAPVAVTGTFWQATQPVSGTFWQATQPVSGTFWQATQPVSIAASVAVTGPLTDAQLRATAVPVSLASTTITGSVAITNANLDAALSTLLSSSTFTTRINTQGQKPMAGSTPVVLASDQASIPVTLASTTITGTVAATQSGAWNVGTLTSITNAVTVAQATAANLRTQTSAESATGATPAANAIQVGGSDGTNLVAMKVDSAGRVITLAQSDTANITRVATSTASATLLSANANRKGAIIVNDSTNVLYVKYGATASATSYTHRVAGNGNLEIPFGYTGRIDAILNTGSANAQVTELL